MWVGLIQSSEGLNRTVLLGREDSAPSHLMQELGQRSSPALGLGLNTIGSLSRFPGLETQTRRTPVAFVGLQLAGGKVWDFSHR